MSDTTAILNPQTGRLKANRSLMITPIKLQARIHGLTMIHLFRSNSQNRIKILDG